MPATRSLTDCERLATAVQEVGGRIPKTLAGILSGAALLNAHSGAATDPARHIVEAAAAGELTADKLDKMLAEAAQQQQQITYRAELRRNSEHHFVGVFHRALEAGAADAILDSLRPAFERHAQAVAEARTLIPPGSIDSFLASATPEAVTAWQQLNAHVSALEKIGRIAAAFGPRTGMFPQIVEYTLGDGFRLDDRAIMCTNGNLPVDSSGFQSPDQGHLSSPWCQTTLKLHTIESAQARYQESAAAEWDKFHSGPQESWIDENGQAHEKPRPTNPYRAAKELARST